MIVSSVSLLLTSRLLWAVASAWVIAQALKIVFSFLEEKKINLHRFIEPGGMPSSHAAMVTALLIGTGIKEGIPSTIFIVTLIFSLAIIYEALGVRRAVGEQAEILNQIIRKMAREGKIKSQNEQEQRYLKETLGHSPLEVAVGSIIGLIIVLIWLA
ncbi:divergent PAP2 family protein [Candidatus Aerophobetes bacterium]|nr:divergent PAP2 family protein [Candidatus Aerophobetes bacterium]